MQNEKKLDFFFAKIGNKKKKTKNMIFLNKTNQNSIKMNKTNVVYTKLTEIK